MTEIDSEDAGIERIRSAVLNVLVVTGAGIGVSGWLLRWRGEWAAAPVSEGVRRALLCVLFGIGVASYLFRRLSTRSSRLLDPSRRAARLYRGHVGAAALGALAVPLGLLYGWWVRPRLEAVGPFWVAALCLGFLALPREGEWAVAERTGPALAPESSESSS